jgi:hypothetical protein
MESIAGFRPVVDYELRLGMCANCEEKIVLFTRPYSSKFYRTGGGRRSQWLAQGGDSFALPSPQVSPQVDLAGPEFEPDMPKNTQRAH